MEYGLLERSRPQAEKNKLSIETERELIDRWQSQKDTFSLGLLINAYQPYISKMASKLTFSADSRPDLINDGIVALIECLNRYVPQGEIRFMSYAATSIRAAMIGTRKSIHFQVEIPRNQKKQDNVALRCNQEIWQGVSHSFSLSEKTDALEAGKDSCPATTLNEKETISLMQATISNALKLLPEDEREIVGFRLRDEAVSPREMAKAIGINPTRAKALEGKAMARLRGILISNGFSMTELV